MHATIANADHKILQFSEFTGRRGPGRRGANPDATPICRERLFVQVILCGSDPDLVGRTSSCRTLSAAADGLAFECELPLPRDALVDVWVDLADQPGKFFLSGRVERSCPTRAATTEPTRTAGHEILVELEEGAATDIAAWRALFD